MEREEEQAIVSRKELDQGRTEHRLETGKNIDSATATHES